MKKLPKAIQGLGGPIEVKLVPKLKKNKDGEATAGRWNGDTRIIKVAANQSLREQRRTLYHEQLHAAFSDSGMSNLVTDAMEEALAELISMYRLVEDGI